MFCNVDALNKVEERFVQSARLQGKISISFLHYFGAIWLFSCNFYAVALLEKCIVMPFFFFCLVLMHDKHFCTRISGKDGKSWLQHFFTGPYTVLHGICKWQKVFSFHFFTIASFLGLKLEADESSRSWTKIKLNLLNYSCIACKTLMVGIGTKTTFFAKWNFKDLSLCK